VTCALLSTGTELTRGDLVNTNATWLAELLSNLGHEVTEICCVDDDEERIVEALSRLARAHRILVVTGGLGPTTDDVTATAAARAAGVPLVRDLRSLARIEALFSARGLVMQPSNAKQADFPSGARVLDNDNGTAPGFAVRIVHCDCYFTPGVPSEMRDMFERQILPLLPEPPTPTFVRRLRTFGMPESRVNDELAGLEDQLGITLGYRASNSEIEVKVFAKRRFEEPLEDTMARADFALAQARARLGDVVYGDGQTSLERVVSELLTERSARLALAESCTGGLLSEMLTRAPGASRFYSGGVCSYANTAKTDLLGVPAELIESCGAVSAEVALAMAHGARRAFGSDWAVGITGIAGPEGGSAEKPVGLVHWAVVSSSTEHAASSVFRGHRQQIQQRAALSALWSLRRALLSSG
jgi:nicotinamide-nucleotide amidase